MDFCQPKKHPGISFSVRIMLSKVGFFVDTITKPCFRAIETRQFCVAAIYEYSVLLFSLIKFMWGTVHVKTLSFLAIFPVLFFNFFVIYIKVTQTILEVTWRILISCCDVVIKSFSYREINFWTSLKFYYHLHCHSLIESGLQGGRSRIVAFQPLPLERPVHQLQKQKLLR